MERIFYVAKVWKAMVLFEQLWNVLLRYKQTRKTDTILSGSGRPLMSKGKEYAIRRIRALPYVEKYARMLLSVWRALNRRGRARYGSSSRVSQSAQNSAVLPLASEFRVATILDEFSHGSFEGEFHSIPIEPTNWRDMFEQHKPSIFFCESAWSGKDSERRPWKGQIYSSINFKNENRGILLNILNYCNKNNIPTIFWNKEDPSHYADKVHNFVETAKRFDFVFTTAHECIDGYRFNHGCKNVYALPFATQPRLFNPIEADGDRSSDVVFAGSWYAVHKERSLQMEQIFDRLLSDKQTLKIYDRHFQGSDPNHHFPEKYQQYLNPPIPHEQLATIYKSSRFGLNFNTVTTSSTMFARRVFELMSSNTLVLSNYSKGMEAMFGDCAIFLDREPDRLRSLSDLEIDKLRERALTLTLSEHTYKRRWEYILSSIGVSYRKEEQATTIVCMIGNRDDAEAVLTFFSRQQTVVPEARLLLLLSDTIPNEEIAQYYQDFNRFGVTVTAKSFARRYRAATYSLVETPNFLLVHPGAFPQEQWLKRALLHLEYAEERLLSCANDANRYKVGKPIKGQILLGRTEFFKFWLNAGDEPIAEFILYV